MKKIACLFISGFLIVAFAGNAQISEGKIILIEKVEKEKGKLIVPYEKYKLDNGLTLIIQEDHSDPMVHVQIDYHVGSTRDEPGRSGFAHFFEHMMFEGSDHVAAGEHHKIIGLSGGSSNGNTTVDRTEYYETVPANYLETALWLEADRMGFFLDSITPKKFEIQRATVKNERGQNYDNKPYGLVNEKMNAALYPPTNPYSTPTIGYIDDLNRANVNELKRFFLRWYGPNNATLVVAGDVNPQEVVSLTKKYFGSINSGPAVPKLKEAPVKLESDRYISYEDNIRNPLLEIVFPTIPTHDSDEAPLDILADILGDGSGSMLYRKFVGGNDPKASSVSVEHPCNEATGKFQIALKLLPGQSLADAEQDVRNSITAFENRGVTDDDLLRYKAKWMTRFFERINTVSGKAELLGYYEWLHGNPNMFQSEYQRYLNVTKEDIMRTYKKYIQNQPAVILSVYPLGKSNIVARADNYTLPKRQGEQPEESEYKNLVYKKSTDNFDRSQKPVAGPAPVLKAPDMWQQEFHNGLKLMGIYNDEIPCVTLELSINAGHTNEDKKNAGIAMLLARMFNESTVYHTGSYYSIQLKKLGSEVYVIPRMDDLVVTVNSTRENLDETLRILEEKLFHLHFVGSEFDWEKNKILDRIASDTKSSKDLANNLFMQLVYSADNIAGIPLTGTSETVNSISLRAVKKYYKKNVLPNNSKLVVVGDIKMEELLPKLDFLKSWRPREVKKMAPTKAPSIDKTRLYFVNKENAAQSEIRIGNADSAYDPLGEQYKFVIMNKPLGDGFNSRINQNLREENGFTYGARSGFYGTKYHGQFIAVASVLSNQTDSSIIQLMSEIRSYADKGATENELNEAKRSVALSEALKYESPEQKANFLWRLQYYNLNKDYIGKQSALLNTLTREEINTLAKKHLNYDHMIILVVGNRSIYESLKKLGYEMVELNTDGKVVTH